MSPIQEQLTALGGVFQAAVLVDRIAKTGQAGEAAVGCLIGSLLNMDPRDTLDVFGGDDLNLRDGDLLLSRNWPVALSRAVASTSAFGLL